MADERVHHPLFARSGGAACPACRFLLTGLPAQGTCPECGSAYDPDSVYRSQPPSAARIALHLALPLAVAAAACLACALTLGSAPSLIDTVALVPAFAACCAFAWASWRAINLIEALALGGSRSTTELPSHRILGCLGSGLAAIVGVISLAVGFALLVAMLVLLIAGALGAGP
jgi:hypothetical protein